MRNRVDILFIVFMCMVSVYSRRIPQSCVSRCPNYFAPQEICASDGLIYMDECRAKCKNPSNVQLFRCKTVGSKTCRQRCKQQAENKEEDCFPNQRPDQEPDCGYCADEPIKYVCGIDGIIYKNKCEAGCYAGNLFYEIGPRYDGKDKITCERHLIKRVCQKSCVSTKAPVRASDGFIYKNKCIAECAGLKIVKKCGKDVKKCYICG